MTRLVLAVLALAVAYGLRVQVERIWARAARPILAVGR